MQTLQRAAVRRVAGAIAVSAVTASIIAAPASAAGWVNGTTPKAKQCGPAQIYMTRNPAGVPVAYGRTQNVFCVVQVTVTANGIRSASAWGQGAVVAASAFAWSPVYGLCVQVPVVNSTINCEYF